MIQLGSLFYRGDLKHVLVFALLESVMCYLVQRNVYNVTQTAKKKVPARDIELTP